ncbi:MAG: serine protease [Chromatiales bacterium]|jgi:S1-C subfamily serine protease
MAGKSYGRLFLWLTFLILPASCFAGSSLPDLIDSVKASVVAIGTIQKTRNPQYVFYGTGFVVDDGKKVITNKHVIPEKIDFEHHEYLAIFTGKGKSTIAIQADLIKQDKQHDLALLEIDKALPAMQLNQTEVREGDTIALTGFPLGMALGLHPVTHTGIVSAITPIAIPPVSQKKLSADMIRSLRNPFLVYQLDATAYPGNSGSPVYHVKSGKVIGVVNSVYVKSKKETAISAPSGISYAIPVKYVHELLQR